MGWVRGDRKYAPVWWHCDKCRAQYCMTQQQSYRYRKAEKDGSLGQKRFYCSVACRREALTELMNTKAYEPKRRDWGASQFGVDPDYYKGYRMLNASPLSYRDRGVPLARPTGARS